MCVQMCHITQNDNLHHWSIQVKRLLLEDPRYDAVGSSSLREELFNTFLNALASGSLPSTSAASVPKQASPDALIGTKSDRKTRTEKALRNREERANQDRERIQKDVGRSKAALTTAESETELMNFFVDAVREPVCFHRQFGDASNPGLG